MTNKGAAFLPIGMSRGISMGVALGVATDNLGLWLSLGVAIGSGLGVALMGAVNARGKKGDGSDGGAVMPPSDTHPQSGQDGGSDGGGDGGGGGD